MECTRDLHRFMPHDGLEEGPPLWCRRRTGRRSFPKLIQSAAAPALLIVAGLLNLRPGRIGVHIRFAIAAEPCSLAGERSWSWSALAPCCECVHRDCCICSNLRAVHAYARREHALKPLGVAGTGPKISRAWRTPQAEWWARALPS